MRAVMKIVIPAEPRRVPGGCRVPTSTNATRVLFIE